MLANAEIAPRGQGKEHGTHTASEPKVYRKHQGRFTGSALPIIGTASVVAVMQISKGHRTGYRDPSYITDNSLLFLLVWTCLFVAYLMCLAFR